jgi:hypothetical protein
MRNESGFVEAGHSGGGAHRHEASHHQGLRWRSACGALRCSIAFCSIAFVVLVQLNYAISPKRLHPSRGRI